jgi:hypothetical protein
MVRELKVDSVRTCGRGAQDIIKERVCCISFMILSDQCLSIMLQAVNMVLAPILWCARLQRW